MKAPKFTKTIRENDVVIGLQAHDGGFIGEFMEDESKGIYQDFSNKLTEKQLLNILSQAYAFGYEMAVSDAKEAVNRVLYERKTAHAPTSRISIKTDYTK